MHFTLLCFFLPAIKDIAACYFNFFIFLGRESPPLWLIGDGDTDSLDGHADGESACKKRRGNLPKVSFYIVY